mgnify:CR=1 FL=1
MPYPSIPPGTNWGHLGVRSPAQFAALNPVTYSMQQVAVDQGNGTVLSYLSNGTAWLPIGGSTGGAASAANLAALAALASGGGLTPFTFYYAVDTGLVYWATSAFTFTTFAPYAYLGITSLATILATPGPLLGMTAHSNDVGNQLIEWYYSGTRWRPRGKQLLYKNATRVGQTAAPGGVGDTAFATPVITIPPNLLKSGFALSGVYAGFQTADGTTTIGTGAPTLSHRLGIANSIADGALAATGCQRTFGTQFHYEWESNTTVRNAGSGNNTVSNKLSSNVNGDFANTLVTCGDLSAVTNYLSFSAANSGGATTWIVFNVLEISIQGTD